MTASNYELMRRPIPPKLWGRLALTWVNSPNSVQQYQAWRRSTVWRPILLHCGTIPATARAATAAAADSTGAIDPEGGNVE